MYIQMYIYPFCVLLARILHFDPFAGILTITPRNCFVLQNRHKNNRVIALL